MMREHQRHLAIAPCTGYGSCSREKPFMIAEGYRNSDPAPISKPKESFRDMPRNPSPTDRQRRLFPMTESSVNLPAEQQRELRMVMADLLLSAFVGSSSNSTKLCNTRRSTEDESKADR
jgi:hypothetical protein